MKNFFKYAAIIAVILVVGSSAWADTYTDHVKIAPNGQGDLLYFPFYVASADGWQTKLTITNTDIIRSVVAKVSVRDAKLSQDVLDFLIYLSPADVWTGKLYFSPTLQKIALFSDDDSVRNTANSAFASTVVGNQFEWALQSSTQFIDFTQGYVEVTEANSFGLAPFGPGTSKQNIFDFYNTTVAARQNTINTLSGKMEVGFVPAGMNATLDATVLQNYFNQTYMHPSQNNMVGVGGRNSLHEVEAALAKNSVAMPYVKNAAGESAIHFFTFPTKYSNWLGGSNSHFFAVQDPLKLDARGEISHGVPTTTGCVPTGSTLSAIEYWADIFDLREQRKQLFVSPYLPSYLCYEANVLSVLRTEAVGSSTVLADVFPFTEGWANYSFGRYAPPTFTPYVTRGVNRSNQVLSYTGAPVIATFLYLNPILGNLQAGYPSWVDGAVYSADYGMNGVNPLQLITDYKYTNLGR